MPSIQDEIVSITMKSNGQHIQSSKEEPVCKTFHEESSPIKIRFNATIVEEEDSSTNVSIRLNKKAHQNKIIQKEKEEEKDQKEEKETFSDKEEEKKNVFGIQKTDTYDEENVVHEFVIKASNDTESKEEKSEFLNSKMEMLEDSSKFNENLKVDNCMREEHLKTNLYENKNENQIIEFEIKEGVSKNENVSFDTENNLLKNVESKNHCTIFSASTAQHDDNTHLTKDETSSNLFLEENTQNANITLDTETQYYLKNDEPKNHCTIFSASTAQRDDNTHLTKDETSSNVFLDENTQNENITLDTETQYYLKNDEPKNHCTIFSASTAQKDESQRRQKEENDKEILSLRVEIENRNEGDRENTSSQVVESKQTIMRNQRLHYSYEGIPAEVKSNQILENAIQKQNDQNKILEKEASVKEKLNDKMEIVKDSTYYLLTKRESKDKEEILNNSQKENEKNVLNDDSFLGNELTGDEKNSNCFSEFYPESNNNKNNENNSSKRPIIPLIPIVCATVAVFIALLSNYR